MPQAGTVPPSLAGAVPETRDDESTGRTVTWSETGQPSAPADFPLIPSYEVLRELGYSSAEVATLRTEGAV